MEVVILAYSSSLTVYTLPNTRYYDNSYLTRTVLPNSLFQANA